MSHSYTYYRSCPYILHDLYLPSIPASFQTLGRVACAVASALAPPGLRIISPLTLTLLSQCFLDACKKIGPEFFLSSICPPSLRSLSLHTFLSPFLLSFFPLPPLGKKFSSLSLSPRLKFACFESLSFTSLQEFAGL